MFPISRNQTDKQTKKFKEKKGKSVKKKKEKKVEKWLSQFETFLVSGGEI